MTKEQPIPSAESELRRDIETLLTSDTTYLIPPGVDETEWLLDKIIALHQSALDKVVREAKYVGGKICACELTEPCMSGCTCANPVMSGGCMRCATYGNYQQRQAAAERLAGLRAGRESDS